MLASTERKEKIKFLSWRSRNLCEHWCHRIVDGEEICNEDWENNGLYYEWRINRTRPEVGNCVFFVVLNRVYIPTKYLSKKEENHGRRKA